MKQPDALRLANDLTNYSVPTDAEKHAAAELRRLHEVNQELVEFAEYIRRTGDTRLASMAIAVIAKATGGQA